MGNHSSSSSRSNSSEESSPDEIQITDPVSNETVTNPPQAEIRNAEKTQQDEEEDLITCGVCWNQFDGDVHKPKFLACHHTFCLQCLQVLEIALHCIYLLSFDDKDDYFYNRKWVKIRQQSLFS